MQILGTHGDEAQCLATMMTSLTVETNSLFQIYKLAMTATLCRRCAHAGAQIRRCCGTELNLPPSLTGSGHSSAAGAAAAVPAVASAALAAASAPPGKPAQMQHQQPPPHQQHQQKQQRLTPRKGWIPQ